VRQHAFLPDPGLVPHLPTVRFAPLVDGHDDLLLIDTQVPEFSRADDKSEYPVVKRLYSAASFRDISCMYYPARIRRLTVGNKKIVVCTTNAGGMCALLCAEVE
jgi:hypothetical protein